MDNNRYKLLGVLIKPKKLLVKRGPRVERGIYTYLDFIVQRRAFGVKRMAYVETTVQEGVYNNGVIVRPQLQPRSTSIARNCMLYDANYREIPGEVEIDLNTQAICQCHKGIVILDAEAIHNYRITLRGLVKKRIREYIEQNPNPPKGE